MILSEMYPEIELSKDLLDVKNIGIFSLSYIQQSRVNPNKPDQQTFKGLYPLEKFGRFAETELVQHSLQLSQDALPSPTPASPRLALPAPRAPPAYVPQLIIEEISDDDVPEDAPFAPRLPDEFYEAQDVDLSAFVNELEDIIETEDLTENASVTEPCLEPSQATSAPITDPSPRDISDTESDRAPSKRRRAKSKSSSFSEQTPNTELIPDKQTETSAPQLHFTFK